MLTCKIELSEKNEILKKEASPQALGLAILQTISYIERLHL